MAFKIRQDFKLRRDYRSWVITDDPQPALEGLETLPSRPSPARRYSPRTRQAPHRRSTRHLTRRFMTRGASKSPSRRTSLRIDKLVGGGPDIWPAMHRRSTLKRLNKISRPNGGDSDATCSVVQERTGLSVADRNCLAPKSVRIVGIYSNSMLFNVENI